MPEHDVQITIPAKLLKNTDATVEVWSDGEKLGELKISKGTVDWRGGNRKSWKRIRWEKFAEALDAAPGRQLRNE